MAEPIDIAREFEALVAAFGRDQIPFAVCGGFAVGIHGFVRATDDIDLLIEEGSVEPAFLVVTLVLGDVWTTREVFAWHGLQVPVVSREGQAPRSDRLARARARR